MSLQVESGPRWQPVSELNAVSAGLRFAVARFATLKDRELNASGIQALCLGFTSDRGHRLCVSAIWETDPTIEDETLFKSCVKWAVGLDMPLLSEVAGKPLLPIQELQS